MTAVTDVVNRAGVGVDDDDEDASRGGGSVGSRQPRRDVLKDSVVARLLLDSRPPSVQTTATRRSNIGGDGVRGLRSVRPPVNLSAGLPVCAHLSHSVLYIKQSVS